VSDLFEALATPARRAILDELIERDGQTLFELCNRLAMKHHLGLTRQAISQHLEILESVGLVTAARQGRYKMHYLHTAPLRTIVERWLKPRKREHQNANRSEHRVRRRPRKGIGLLHSETRFRKEVGHSLGGH